MLRLQRRFPVFIAVMVITVIGCGGSSTDPNNRTPAQFFKQEQGNTMTPHGKIMPDSVEERDGKLEYKTEDAKKWRVGYSKRADGTYQYGMPEEIKSYSGN
jgi:hypothetical protein